MTLRCYAVDDEPRSLKKIKDFILDTPGLEFAGAETSSIKAKQYLSDTKNLPDIIFLDVEMQPVNGLELAGLIKGKVLIIFTTGHRDFAVESYQFNAVDYLLKPFDYEKFRMAIDKCRELKRTADLIARDEEKLIFIKDSLSKGEHAKVNSNEVVYIQSIGNYCKIFFANNKYRMPHMPMKSILKDLNNDDMLRVHKSNAINLKYVESYDGAKKILMKNNAEVEVGRTFKKILKERLNSRK